MYSPQGSAYFHGSSARIERFRSSIPIRSLDQEDMEDTACSRESQFKGHLTKNAEDT